MTDIIPLDSNWIAANPPPVHGQGTTKNSRGRVLAIGGSAMVPGALRLTGEAALRVGAGKLQMATIASAAIGLGLLVPEAGVLALPEDADGEVDGTAGPSLEKSLNSCDTLVIGPGMGSAGAANALLRLVLAQPCDNVTLVVDAIAIGSARDLRDARRNTALSWFSKEAIPSSRRRTERRCIMVAGAPDLRPADRAMFLPVRSVACCPAAPRRSSRRVGACGCTDKADAGSQLREARSDFSPEKSRPSSRACFHNNSGFLSR
jgi:hypothetical protein